MGHPGINFFVGQRIIFVSEIMTSADGHHKVMLEEIGKAAWRV
jgi:hypothetical protein